MVQPTKRPATGAARRVLIHAAGLVGVLIAMAAAVGVAAFFGLHSRREVKVLAFGIFAVLYGVVAGAVEIIRQLTFGPRPARHRRIDEG